jgi:hypothetical protein
MTVLVAAGGAAYAYHNVTVADFQRDIAQLEANNRTLKNNQVQLSQAVDTANASLEAAQLSARDQQEAIAGLTQKNNELARVRDQYLEIFKNHDLTNLARAKPGLIEPRINRGTKEVFESIEEDSREVADAGS